MPKSPHNCLDSATPKEDCTHTIKSQFKAVDLLSRGSGCMVSGDPNAVRRPAILHESSDSALLNVLVSAPFSTHRKPLVFQCGDPSYIAEHDGGFFQLTYAAFHCHAPACISGELWNADTGELICRNTAQYGTSLAAQDEKGYGKPPTAPTPHDHAGVCPEVRGRVRSGFTRACVALLLQSSGFRLVYGAPRPRCALDGGRHASAAIPITAR